MKKSVIVKEQKKHFGPVLFKENGFPYATEYKIQAHVRYDDQCGNGHNTFAITGSTWRKERGSWREDSGGCLQEEVAKHFPELAPAIKWHLFDSRANHINRNALYFAGARDCWGLNTGEFNQHTSRGPHQANGIEGIPCWDMVLPAEPRQVYAAEKPKSVVVEWTAHGMTGKGKERELDAARRAAVWLDATDEELTAPGLEERLTARLPKLLEDFASMVEGFGFTF